jgi:D-citramalate synthase
VLKSPDAQLVHVESYHVTVGTGSQPRADVVLAARRRRARASANGDGGYDAFMNALRKAARRLDLPVAQLTDFRVRIPPGGQSAALVETVISWKGNGRADEGFTTLGVDSDQLAAAVIATEKMLNALASRAPRRGSARSG